MGTALTPYRGNIYSPPREVTGLGNTIYPLPGLRREDADVAIIYLAAGVKYHKVVDDPWFSAHKTFADSDVSDSEHPPLYKPDNPFSAMGCTIQVLVGKLS